MSSKPRSKSAFLMMLLTATSLMSVSFASEAFASEDKPKKAESAAKKKAKKTAKSYKITGGLQISASTDRNAGVAPISDGLKGAPDDDDEDEDEDIEDDDVFEDLDLDDQDAIDQLNESIDEDGDGDFFDEDGPGEDEEGDLDGDSIADADEIPGDDDGDGVPDALDTFTDGDGDGIADDPDVQAMRAPGGRRPSRRDERMTYTANVGYTQKIGGWAKEWKSSAKVASTDFDKLQRNDTVLIGVNSGPVFKVKSLKAQIQPSLIYAHLRKDGTDIFSNYGAALTGQFKLDKDWKLNLRYGFDARNFEDPRIETIRAHSWAAKLQYAIGKNHSVSFGYTNRLEDTDFLQLARTKDQNQFTLGYQKKWENGFYVKPQVAFAFIERNAIAKRNQPVREDDRVTYNLALGKEFAYGINAELQYSSMETDTNIRNKDTSNDRFVFVTGWKF